MVDGLVMSSELIMRYNKLYRKQAAMTSKHEDREQITVQNAQHNPTGAENEKMYVSIYEQKNLLEDNVI